MRVVKAGGGTKGWHPGVSKTESRFLIESNLFRMKLNTSPPGSGGGDGHRHTRQEHGVYVVSGRAEISLDHGDWQALEPGDAIHIPAGVNHRVRLVGDEPLACLMIDVPAEDEAENQ